MKVGFEGWEVGAVLHEPVHCKKANCDSQTEGGGLVSGGGVDIAKEADAEFVRSPSERARLVRRKEKSFILEERGKENKSASTQKRAKSGRAL